MNSTLLSAAVLAVMLLVGCTQSPSEELSKEPEIAIIQAVLDKYENAYLTRQTPIAFAVSQNGRTYFYSYCDGVDCLENRSNAKGALSEVISYCSERGQGPCVLFAVGRSAPRKYHVID